MWQAQPYLRLTKVGSLSAPASTSKHVGDSTTTHQKRLQQQKSLLQNTHFLQAFFIHQDSVESCSSWLTSSSNDVFGSLVVQYPSLQSSFQVSNTTSSNLVNHPSLLGHFATRRVQPSYSSTLPQHYATSSVQLFVASQVAYHSNMGGKKEQLVVVHKAPSSSLSHANQANRPTNASRRFMAACTHPTMTRLYDPNLTCSLCGRHGQ
ncbi:hypothetical protein F4821DRAFT_134376 [Hypoxylon rubiginosum]|uniref:Uncharacterized protein n=1 Tax=Hypoxylon rubiginosum TaxID=110542 RepID=A0ACC0DHU7_9PEZI|nr:hypothetical protein F4821DRAFT_134376 [Hypoxylon rubiginosum]